LGKPYGFLISHHCKYNTVFGIFQHFWEEISGILSLNCYSEKTSHGAHGALPVGRHGDTEEETNFSIFLFVLPGNSEENMKFTNNNSVSFVNSVSPCDEIRNKGMREMRGI
jgi:hypothetical protein